MSDSRRLGVSVLGAGRWGRNLVRVFESLERARLVSVCDRDAARLACLQTDAERVHHHSDVFGDPRVDAVVIATPAETHGDLAVAAFEAGKHVFVEKPMALSMHDARRVLSAARRHRRRGMVGLVLHYHPAFEQLAQWIERGTLGTVERVFCTRHNPASASEDGSPWWSLAPHDISVSRLLLRGEPEAITLTEKLAGGARMQHARLRFSGGGVAEISVASGMNDKTRQVVVLGTDATAFFDDTRAERKLMLFEGVLPEELSPDRVPCTRMRPKLVPKLPLFEPLRLEATHFVDAIRNGTPFRTELAAGARVVAILEAGQCSLESAGRPFSPTQERRSARLAVHTETAATDAAIGSRIA